MTVFRYWGFLQSGKKVSGIVVAEERDEAVEILKRKGIYPTKLLRLPKVFVRFLPLSDKAIALFFRGLSDLVRAEMNIQVAVDLLAKDQFNPRIALALYTIRDFLASGYSVSDSFRRAGIFPEDVIAMVKVGEETASLPEVFRNLADYYEEKERLKRGLMGAVAYPVFLVFVTILALSFVIPRVIHPLVEMINKVGSLLGKEFELPWITVFVLETYDFFSKNGVYVLYFLFVLVASVYYAYRRFYSFKRFSDNLLVKIPLLGEFLYRLFLYRTMYSIFLLYSAGINLVRAFRLVSDLTTVEVFKEDLKNIQEKLERGVSFEVAILNSYFFPESYKVLIKVGIRSGTLLDTFRELYYLSREGFFSYTEFLRKTAYPVALVLVGLLVGVVVVSVYYPVFKAVGTLRSF